MDNMLKWSIKNINLLQMSLIVLGAVLFGLILWEIVPLLSSSKQHNVTFIKDESTEKGLNDQTDMSLEEQAFERREGSSSYEADDAYSAISDETHNEKVDEPSYKYPDTESIFESGSSSDTSSIGSEFEQSYKEQTVKNGINGPKEDKSISPEDDDPWQKLIKESAAPIKKKTIKLEKDDSPGGDNQ